MICICFMNLSTFDLNLLRILDALLAENSTVNAGKRLGLSQPAVSAALSRLRHTLGDELFVRQGQGMTPTDYAKSLELPLRAALDGIEGMLVKPKAFDPGTARGTFRLSGSDFFTELLMPKLADKLAKEAPGLRVQMVDLLRDSYVDTIERYEVDIAFIPEIPLPNWADHVPAFRNKFSVIARKNHPSLKSAGVEPGQAIPLDLYCELGHVLFSPEGNLHGLGDQALASIGQQRRVVMSMPVFSGVYHAVASSDLIGLIPDPLAVRVAEKANLEVYQAPMPIEPVTIIMIWHKRSTATPLHQWFRNQIAGILAAYDHDAALPQRYK